MSRPWLVAWGLSTLIDAPSDSSNIVTMNEISNLMKFRARHFPRFFYFAGSNVEFPIVQVGVLASFRHNNEKSTFQPTARALQALGVPFRFETEISIIQYQTLNTEMAKNWGTEIKLLICDNMATMDEATAIVIAEWVRRGGLLIATSGLCANKDAAGRTYPIPLLEKLLNRSDSTGLGTAIFIDGQLVRSQTAVSKMLDFKVVMAPRTPLHPKTTSWEVVPWY